MRKEEPAAITYKLLLIDGLRAFTARLKFPGVQLRKLAGGPRNSTGNVQAIAFSRVLSRSRGFNIGKARALYGRVHLKTAGSMFRSRGLTMRFPLAVAVVLASMSVNGLAQQSGNGTIRVKPSHSAEKAPKRSAPIGKTASPATTSTANAKDLQTLERQTAKSSAPSRSAGKRTPGMALALKPAREKDKPNPPINFHGNGGSKSPGMTNQGTNPYKSRLKQKHAHQ